MAPSSRQITRSKMDVVYQVIILASPSPEDRLDASYSTAYSKSSNGTMMNEDETRVKEPTDVHKYPNFS